MQENIWKIQDITPQENEFGEIILTYFTLKEVNPGKRVALFPTRRCSSYWKGSFRVNLD